MQICFIPQSLESPVPIRRGAVFELPNPHSLSIVPGGRVAVDLLLAVQLPPGCLALLQLKRQSLDSGDRLHLHADVVGKLFPE